MITAVIEGRSRMVVRGLDPDCKKSELEDAGEEFAEWLQQQIADLFEEEKTFKGALKANTKDYEKDKEALGFDDRKGHREGNLQQVLNTVDLWDVRVNQRQGKVTISLSDSRLHGEVEYAEFYEEAKVRGGAILGFRSAWTKKARDFFEDCEKKKGKR